MIYFVQCNGPEGPVKIGWVKDAGNLWKRMATFSTGNPYPLMVLGTVTEGTLEEEAELHAKFRPYLIQGEWFSFNKHIRNHIKSHCLGGGLFKNTSYAAK